MKVIIIGPAWPLRGWLATFDQRLCKAFQEEGYEHPVIYLRSLSQCPGKHSSEDYIRAEVILSVCILTLAFRTVGFS